MRRQKGITLIALVLTIIILIILAAVSVNLVLGENGIMQRAQSGAKEYNIKAAQEAMEMKIAAADMKYGGRATLQQLADELCEDEEVEYVELASQVASLDKVNIGETTELYTKLIAYSFEFEINKDNKIESIEETESLTPKIRGVKAVGFDGGYDGNPHSIEVTTRTEGVTITYSTDGTTYTSTNPSYTDVGEYTVYYKLEKADCDTVTGSRTVKITKKFVTSIELDKEEIMLGKTKTYQLVATVGPDDAYDKTLNWTSSNTSVATVSNTGLITAVAVGTCTITCTAADGSGISKTCDVTIINGTTIANKEELKAILGGSGYKNDTYILINDIDLTGENWTPISDFNGVFDGNGHSIINLTINSTSDYVGFFGTVRQGTIKNVKFVNPNVTTTGNSSGIVAGRYFQSGYNVSQVAIEGGSLTGKYNLASFGTVNGVSSGTIKNCYSTAKIIATDKFNACGIERSGDGYGTVTNCYYKGEISMLYTDIYPIRSANKATTNCFYDKTLFSQSTNDSNTKAVGLTTEEFADQSNFEGWDFENTWIMKDGRPELRIFVK